MMRGCLAGGAPAFFLIVSLLLVPAIQAAVAKPNPKPKPKPKATPKRPTWKRMSRNISWQLQLDDNGSISRVKVRWNRDHSVQDGGAGLHRACETLCIIKLLPVGLEPPSRAPVQQRSLLPVRRAPPCTILILTPPRIRSRGCERPSRAFKSCAQ